MVIFVIGILGYIFYFCLGVDFFFDFNFFCLFVEIELGEKVFEEIEK